MIIWKRSPHKMIVIHPGSVISNTVFTYAFSKVMSWDTIKLEIGTTVSRVEEKTVDMVHILAVIAPCLLT